MANVNVTDMAACRKPWWFDRRHTVTLFTGNFFLALSMARIAPPTHYALILEAYLRVLFSNVPFGHLTSTRLPFRTSP